MVLLYQCTVRLLHLLECRIAWQPQSMEVILQSMRKVIRRRRLSNKQQTLLNVVSAIFGGKMKLTFGP